MSKFKVGDKVRRVNPDGDHEYWNEPSDNLFHGKIYTVADLTNNSVILAETSGKYRYSLAYFELVESVRTYTQSELDYIQVLESRICQLEDLCSDYTKIVADKDYLLKSHEKVLDKFFKSTVLVSENHKVADLIGARIGDDVADKIHDYLVNQVK